MKKKKTLIICIIILLVAGAVIIFIFLTEPTAKQEGATKETPMLVEVIEVQRGTFRPTIEATGIVQPSKDILLSPRVSGEVIHLSDGFTPGGLVEKGEILLQIDPADYRNNLQLRKGELSQAEADLEIEQGRQAVARQDYELVDDMLTSENENLELVLREPQLNAAKAQVEAARAAVNQEQLNLKRTTIRAPFDAHVLSRNVNVGSQVSPGDNLGRLVGGDEYWVVITVPRSRLPWIAIPKEGKPGSEVELRDRKAWKEGAYRTGHIYRLVGALENQTRMARILVSVPDPLAYKNDSLPALMINSFMEASIQAEELPNVFRLSRDYLRKNETVWVMEEEQLRIKDVGIILQDAKYAYISSGLEENDLIVTTSLSTVIDGARLRTASERSNNENTQSSGSER